MPTYDYQCRSCGHTVEVIHSMTEEGPDTCERCGGALRRVLYPTGIIFKGSGFYKTDSRATRSSSTSPAKKPDAGSSDTPAAGQGTTADKPKEPAKTEAPAKSEATGS